jgi:flavin reductase (DIM6/NTAB) family NADH-FMN oxidoreductase RutF
VDADAFDALMRTLDPAMAVVTAANGDELAGCLVGFHGQTSIDPPRYGVWLSKANHTYRVALKATHVGVHLLPDTDGGRDVAEWFGTRSGDAVDKFTARAHTRGPGGVPLLADCPDRFVLRRTVLLDDGGDHVCLTGDPVDAASTGSAGSMGSMGSFPPLRLHRVADLAPGHTAGERPSPPTERAPGD